MKLALRSSLAGLAMSFLVGCGGAAVQAQQDRPVHEEPFRRFAGSPARVQQAVRATITDFGGVVTAEQEGRALQGRVTVGEVPVWIYVKLGAGGRVQVRSYNLGPSETVEFRDRFFARLEAMLGSGGRG